MRKTIKNSLLCVLGMVFVSLAACGKASSQSAETAGAAENNIVYVCGVEPASMDVAYANDANTSRILLQVHETLYKRNENAEVVPVLAESAVQAEDGLSWTITLKKGITFHDGTPFNAAAVKYTFDRLLAPETVSPRASALASVQSIEVPGEYEVKMNLKGKDPIFLASLTNYSTSIMSPTAGEKYGLKEYTHNPAGTGPLKMQSWDRGIEMVFVPNENYWGPKPEIDKLTVKYISEDSSRVMMIKTGDADVIAGVPPTLVPDLEADKNVSMVTRLGYRTIFIGINNSVKPFTDARVRAAVNYAINKRAIIDNILKGLATYPSGFISPALEYAATDLDPHEQNIAKAKQLLAEAGFPTGFKTKIFTPEGRYPMDRQVAEVVQAMLGEAGIAAEVNVMDFGAYIDAAKAGKTELFLLGKGGSTGDPEFDLLMHVITDGAQNYYRYSNPKADKILKEIRNAKTLEERARMLHECQKIVNDDFMVAPLYYENQFFATRSNLEGLKVYPNELIDLAWLVRK